jgi:23S rRNA pseudouridine1911/1915/1917 synthase
MTQSRKTILKIDESISGLRLDQALAKLIPDSSRAHLQKLIKDGNVKLNESVCEIPKTKIEQNDSVEITFPEEEELGLIAEKIDLPVLFEDKDLIVINKPPGIVVHPAAGNWTGTIVNALAGRDSNFTEELQSDDLRPGIVHRLDKDTSGCLVVAKNPESQFKLSKAFAERNVKKTYAALVFGHPKRNSERIETLIGRHKTNRKKMAVVERNGKEAISLYKTIEKGFIDKTPVSLLEVEIFTGRTHQIRVHLAYKKLPVIGDTVYGGKQSIQAERQMLHAWKLSFPHPTNGKEMNFESPFPEDLKTLLESLENHA